MLACSLRAACRGVATEMVDLTRLKIVRRVDHQVAHQHVGTARRLFLAGAQEFSPPRSEEASAPVAVVERSVELGAGGPRFGDPPPQLAEAI
jgi:hypothetical protein